ncbi:MAG: hypothetical protein Q9221_002620 [Calogaya cf. arnoldii]
MSTDYSKKKNAELEELLKSRSLPHTGKKADLIARLQQSDKEASAAKPATSKIDIPPIVEDEIDWDDDAIAADIPTTNTDTTSTSIPPKSASTPAAAVAIAAGGKGQAPNPTAVPNQIPTSEPFNDDFTVKAPGESIPEAKPTTTTTDTTTKPEEPAKPPTEYTAHIPLSTHEEELEKRRKRAERFNIPTDAEAVKKLERAKKFSGTNEAEKPSVVKGLDEALPERKKRGRGVDDEGVRGGKRGRGGWRGERSRSKSKGRGTPVEGKKAGAVNGTGNVKSGGDAKAAQKKKDVEAAEARKKRFAATG